MVSLLLEIVASAAVYFLATLLVESGWLQWSYHRACSWVKKSSARILQRQHSRQGYEHTLSEAADEGIEDEDVREERQALQAGQYRLSNTCVLDQLSS